MDVSDRLHLKDLKAWRAWLKSHHDSVRKFTPRRAGSNWSASNRKRLRKLLDQGRMMAPGLASIEGESDE